MVALGDLAFRFPNAVEPWTEHLYGLKQWGNSLHDSDAGVRQHAITVLAHLVLNDMMKVKGHIAEMARCLEDADPRVASVARLLFHELSRKHGNPIYNLLPDLLSRLTGDETIEPAAFQRIMTRLLGFIDKDRQTEALADKFGVEAVPTVVSLVGGSVRAKVEGGDAAAVDALVTSLAAASAAAGAAAAEAEDEALAKAAVPDFFEKTA